MRKLIKLALAALMVCSLFACSSNSSSSEPENSGDSQQGENTSLEGTTITIWHSFTEAQEVELQRLATEFEKETGVHVECLFQPNKDFESVVYEAVSSGVGPDFLFHYASTGMDYQAYGKSLNFSEYWGDFDYKSLVSEGVYQEGTQGFNDGGVHSVAVQTTGPVYFYNATWFEELNLEVPTTWDEVWETSKAIYEAKGVPGFAVDSMSDFLQILILQSNDGKYVDLENKEVLWNTDEVKEWVKWFKEGCMLGYFQVAASGADGYNSSDLVSNVLGAYIGSSAGIPYVTMQEGQELGVAPVQQVDPANPYVVGWNRGVIGIKSDDENKNKAVTEFAKFMTRPENAASWAMTLSAYSPYAGAKVVDGYEEYVAGNLALTALGQQVDYAVVIPTFGNASFVRDELKTLITSAASDPNSDVDALFEAAVSKCNAAIKEAN